MLEGWATLFFPSLTGLEERVQNVDIWYESTTTWLLKCLFNFLCLNFHVLWARVRASCFASSFRRVPSVSSMKPVLLMDKALVGTGGCCFKNAWQLRCSCRIDQDHVGGISDDGLIGLPGWPQLPRIDVGSLQRGAAHELAERLHQTF